jgi:serine protease Do
VITLVDPGGTAAEQGLKKGDIIIEAGQTAINSLRDVKDKIEKARREGRKSILLLMERQSGIGFIAIRIGQG